MGQAVGLYEYLSVEVQGRSEGTTRLTASVETYDDDLRLGSLEAVEGTRVTYAFQGETFDDDNGLLRLDGLFGEGTAITHADSDPYDDASPDGLGNLQVNDESTMLTRVQGETYDDDSGLGSLAGT